MGPTEVLERIEWIKAGMPDSGPWIMIRCGEWSHPSVAVREDFRERLTGLPKSGLKTIARAAIKRMRKLRVEIGWPNEDKMDLMVAKERMVVLASEANQLAGAGI